MFLSLRRSGLVPVLVGLLLPGAGSFQGNTKAQELAYSVSVPAVIAPTGVYRMNEIQIFECMRRAGFPSAIAVSLTAVALRESRGFPAVINDNPDTKDYSFGLLQINFYGALGPARLKQFGIKDPHELLDPDACARAAFLIWDHNNENLYEAWAIRLDGYREQYEIHLPAAMRAALLSPMSLAA